LEVNANVGGGELVVNWTYSEGAHKEETVRRLAEVMMGGLRAMVEEGEDEEAEEEMKYSTADFPEAELTQEELDNLMTRLSQ
jgi:non-ribosomal peptide synthase protein (TIGR01720 family)